MGGSGRLELGSWLCYDEGRFVRCGMCAAGHTGEPLPRILGTGPILMPGPPSRQQQGDAMRLSTFITRNLEQILVEWESFAASLLAPGQAMTSLALRDHARE